MTARTIAPTPGIATRLLARKIAILATSLVLIIAAAALPGGNSTGGGVLSAATSAVAPTEAHAFLRVPSGFTRWLEFQSRKQRPYCFGGPCADAELA